MSNPSRVTNSRNEIEIETPNKNCLYNFLERIRSFCNCFSAQNEENVLPLVHAVDSVRLVYMRRIEEASMLNLRRQSQPDEHVIDEVQPRVIRHRRMKQERSTIEALEKALKEYETKNKTIMSNTRVPEVISFDKSYKISRSSQTDTQELLNELLKAVDTVKMKESFNSEEIRHVILNSSNDKCTNTEMQQDTQSDLKNQMSMEVIKTFDVQGDSKSTINSLKSISIIKDNK